MIQEDEPEYNLKAFKDVDKSAIDLLKAMLSKNGEDRPSASDCLKHPWFTNDQSMAETHLTPTKKISLEIAFKNLSTRQRLKEAKSLYPSQNITVH